MSWKDLITKEERLTLPWLGSRSLYLGTRAWTIEGPLPHEHGWYSFLVTSGRRALLANANAEPAPEVLFNTVKGYLVGDHLVSDTTPNVDPNPQTITKYSEKVNLLEDGLDRFVRVSAGRFYENGPLVYKNQEMPLGPEEEVLNAFLDNLADINHVKGVTPALDASFRMETWQRAEAERRRLELERLRQEEEARRLAEERRKKIVEQLGDAVGRREMAKLDFAEAAKAALAMGNAEYLDHRKNARKGEMVVRYRLNRRKFECVVDEKTLKVVEAGICLNDYETGTKGDKLLSLESLPSVVSEAQREGKLVVFRHVH